jgi:hypothetical protein
VSTSTLNVRTLNVRAGEPRSDAEATFREEFLSLVAQVGLGRDRAVALVEAVRGRPFTACGAQDLVSVLDELLALARRIALVHRVPACHG